MNALTRTGPRTASIGSFTGLLTPVVIDRQTAAAPTRWVSHAETGETVPAELEDSSGGVPREDGEPLGMGEEAGPAVPAEDAELVELGEDASAAVSRADDAGSAELGEDTRSGAPAEDVPSVEPLAGRGGPRGRSWLPWRRSSRSGEEGAASGPEQLVMAVAVRASRGRHRLTGRSAPVKSVQPVEPVEPAPGLGSEREPSQPPVSAAQPADVSGPTDDESSNPAVPSRYSVLNNARVVWTASGSDLP